MARHVSRQPVAAAAFAALLTAALFAPVSAAPDRSSQLVSYGFDEDVATGPDTLRVFQNARGSVRLSSDFRLGGYRSVEIRDVAGDGDFPELLGRFPIRSDGRLYAHFGILVTDPAQPWNVALAGPEWFALRKDGIGFWLQGREGSLYHVSDSIPKRLLPLRAFVWYVVDLAYDVEAGTYDLSIHEEGAQTPAISLKSQPNASAQPGSSVSVFSFIGDHGSDESEVVYYVDDIALVADRPVEMAPFVAPGRRQLFIDAWSEHRKRLAKGPVCFPVSDIENDLGLRGSDLSEMPTDARDILTAALDPRGPRHPKKVPERLVAPLAAVAAWSAGCEALQSSRISEALAAFEKAESLWPRGTIYPLSRALALARAKRGADADQVLDSIAGIHGDDIRLTIARAVVGISRDDLDAARRVLAPPAEGAPFELGPDAQRLAEHYFLVLLWQSAFEEALRYASAVEARLRDAGLPGSTWKERIGDAAFFLGDASQALRGYRDAALTDGESPLLYEKLADACFRLGDLEQERVWRERVYGSLR